MDKKQYFLQAFYILIILAIIIASILLVVKPNEKIENNTVEAVTPEKEENKNNNKDNINYTTFPKYANSYLKKSKIIDIGGTNNEKLLKEFVFKDEIILLVETNSENIDFNIKNKQIVACIMDKDLTLNKTINLEKTENCSYLDCTIFEEGILLLVNESNNSMLLKYNKDFILEESLYLEKFDDAKIVNNVLEIKLISLANKTVNYRIIDSKLNVVNSCKIDSKISSIFDDVFCYKNMDIFVGKNENSFTVFKSKIIKQSDNIYYIIEQIDIMNYGLCSIMPNSKNINELIITAKNNENLAIFTLDILEEKITKNSNIFSSKNASIIGINNGYILHDFDTNFLQILDNNFNVIIDKFPLNLDANTLDYYHNPFFNEYIFWQDNPKTNKSFFYSLSKDLSKKEILSLPKNASKISIKSEENCRYIFVETNNNFAEFSNLYGGYDIFAIKLQED